MVEIILRTAAVVFLLFFLVLIGLLVGMVVDPYAEVVLDNPTVQELGWDEGLSMALTIGLSLVLPLLGLAAVIWAHTAELQRDVGMRRRF